MKICDWAGIDSGFERLVAGIDAGQHLASPFAALGMPHALSLAQQQRCAEQLVENLYPAMPALPPATPRTPHPRIRLGYFSADLYSHATAHLMAGLFEQHDRMRFEVIAFSFGPPNADAMRSAARRRIRPVPRGGTPVGCRHRRTVGAARNRYRHRPEGLYPARADRDIRPSRCATAAQLPRLSGHHGRRLHRLPDRRPHRDSAGAHQPLQREDRLAAALLSGQRRQAGDRPTECFSRQEAGLPEQGFVFCCFNNNWKITPAVFSLWMQLLQGSQRQRAVALRGQSARPAPICVAKQSQHGVDAGAPGVCTAHEPAASIWPGTGSADLFLDTLPYNAHTTASDALWARLAGRDADW